MTTQVVDTIPTLSQSQLIWKEFKKNKIALTGLFFLFFLTFLGLYAPFFASSKPLLIQFKSHYYSPLLRYLFYPGFFTKPLDIFFNLLMFILPLFLVALKVWPKAKKQLSFFFLALQIFFTCCFSFGLVKNPELSLSLQSAREGKKKDGQPLSWEEELRFKTPYEKINTLLRYKQQKAQVEDLAPYTTLYQEKNQAEMPLLYELERLRIEEVRSSLKSTLTSLEEEYYKAKAELPALSKNQLPYTHQLTVASLANESSIVEEENLLKKAVEEKKKIIQSYEGAENKLLYLEQKEEWLANESEKVTILLSPLVRSFHWEEDAAGNQLANHILPFWELSRLNRKDLTSALIFGIRISLSVGIATVALSLLIGIPLGLVSGFFGGRADLFILRGIEIWEAMPTFFTLLLISAILESKSLFLTIFILGLFSWTGMARFTRAEVLRERKLPYVLASKSCGFPAWKTIFSHILPNAISPVLALLPFAMMTAITAEAGLSFLGLGEEGSTSLGVLMSEARALFPGESFLLWPPALLLTLLLVSIALVGDGFRDALDPKTVS